MHVLVAAVHEVRASLKSVADVSPTFVPTEEKAALLRELVAVEAQVTELRLRVMAAAGDVADVEGFHSVGTWLAHRARVRRGDAVADLRLAHAMEQVLPLLASRLREGRITVAQARVIAAAVDELPDGVEADLLARVEAELVRLAADHGPKDLLVLGRHILEVIDPERFEDEERRRIEAAERRAQERQRLRIRAVGDGTSRISGVVPDAVATRLARYLHAFTNPRLADGAVRTVGDEQPGATEVHGRGRGVSHPRRLAEAFAQLLETLDPGRLPVHGGDATHLVVTLSFGDLVSGLGTATLDAQVPGDGYDRITAGQARRLACNARIIPAVLGADSEVLDLGRSSRLFTKAQRRALLLRDATCRAEGCTIPGAWAEAHHLRPWSHHGSTDLDNAALLCSRHHHRAHDATYDMTRLANGELRFHRRT